MIYKEEKRDLFKVPEDYFLAHCISADAHMSAGIAVEFKRRFQLSGLQKAGLGFPDCVQRGKVFNLITKQRFFHKPTPAALAIAIGKMKEQAEKQGVKKIAMPMIGAGLDRLPWGQNRETIKRIFQDTEIEILVCIWK